MLSYAWAFTSERMKKWWVNIILISLLNSILTQDVMRDWRELEHAHAYEEGKLYLYFLCIMHFFGKSWGIAGTVHIGLKFKVT